ncbi:hypothetical protein GCM10027275_14270 [Rhabdobacter roseus]|uniref:Outer membrane protein beta-barrel domain-containing protein n=1 Tax=Rhabdobacter roseus TaxID=1655419 RepID=A0A840TGS1_9BACT|nr:hypothetical protein [Rhabdobacter roseus]MBB5283346.1 hypothetical protein [Rhabdobacter roseus]
MKYAKLWILVLLFSGAARAQDATNIYSMPSPFDRYSHYLATGRVTAAIPIGTFADQYIDKTSLENYSLSVEWIFQGALSAGGEVGYAYFQTRLPRQVYQLDGQDVSAVQTRTLTQYPIQGFVNYHLAGRSAIVRPYVHLSAGGSFVDYSLFYGNLADQQQKFQFAYGAGLGSKFLFKKDGSLGADLRVKYSQTALNYDYVTKGISSINASFGLFYRWW